ncbi:phosphoribosyltransferase [Streptomyces qinzhouensis]|uniref:Uncharacterized protein n=1 Tax=Streptomyces qinzhouensis TaxID=2599401 RepID=A0A5B8J0X6_9ACTN|nr:phosphoribosyltransferase family protein [Streptomyces qinzhouensis]QDY75345.1 hypothetical protein FQU76_01215 [Streptomyces qinzhouensis]
MNTPAPRGLVVTGCSRRKAPTTRPALELYGGWCFPQLRERIAHRPELRARTLIVSARHGLLTADTPVAPYEQPLTTERVAELRREVSAGLREHLARHPAEEVLLLLEPLYLRALGRMPVPVVHTVSDPAGHWPAAALVLDGWGWTALPATRAGCAGSRVFEGKRIWRMSQDAFRAAAALIAANERPFAPELVVGLARGGVPLAREAARILNVPAVEVSARHNVSDLIGIQSTGEVEVDEERLLAAVAGARRVLVADDICGTGATLRVVTTLLAAAGVEARTAVLCRNEGAAGFPLDVWVWPVADWTCFPWEAPPPDGSTLLPHPQRVHTSTAAPSFPV